MSNNSSYDTHKKSIGDVDDKETNDSSKSNGISFSEPNINNNIRYNRRH